MGRLLRFADGERWAIALQSLHLPLPADPLWDMRTHDNGLSVYALSDDLAELDRVMIGFAAPRDKIPNLDALVFDEALVSRLGIEVRKDLGNTSLVDVNELHRSLVGLSAADIVNLADGMRRTGQIVSRSANEMKQLFATSINTGAMERQALSRPIRQQLILGGAIAE